MLEIRSLSVSYGQHRALDNVSLRVAPGEIVVILGANGAGKSTLLRTVSGLCEGSRSGAVEMDGHPLLGLRANQIVERGIALVPEGRGIFGEMTVRENLLLGAYSPRARADQQANMDHVFSLFPKLAERRSQVARTMSGGEQQMVAIGRAMMSAPSILMLDEPSLGLSPILCKELFQSLRDVRGAGLGILLVEQNARQSLAIADRGYLLENTRIVHEDTAASLASDPAVQKAYLGAGAAVREPARPPAGGEQQPTPSEIAADALNGLPFISGSGIGRRAAVATRPSDDLIGEPIDDLVRRASRPPATRVTSLGETPSSHAAMTGGADRLREVLAEIERAAANARRGNGKDKAE